MAEQQSDSNRLEVTEIGRDIPVENIAGSTEPIRVEVDNYGRDEVGPGKTISCHFSLKLAGDGVLIDDNFDRDPVSFEVGDGNFLPGFERVLLGLKAGSIETFVVPCEKAFGQCNDDNVQTFPRKQFAEEMVLSQGLMVSFADAKGNEQAAVVLNADSDSVTVDFNHPLAGRDIEFKVEILTIEAITK